MLSLLFSFRGRINRNRYWFGMLLVGFASFVGQVLVQVLSAGPAATAHTLAERFAAYAGASTLLMPVSALTLWASLAVQWKRLHDRGRPGWISLFPLVVMLMTIGAVVADIFSGVDIMIVINNALGYLGLLMLMSFALFIDLGCLPGKDEPNRYGDPPGSAPSGPARPLPGAPSSNELLSVKAAMDRAIAERAAAPTRVVRPAPIMAAPQPAAAGPRSFGRRTTR